MGVAAAGRAQCLRWNMAERRAAGAGSKADRQEVRTADSEGDPRRISLAHVPALYASTAVCFIVACIQVMQFTAADVADLAVTDDHFRRHIIFNVRPFIILYTSYFILHTLYSM